MPDAISKNEIDRLANLSEEELFGELGKTLEVSAIEYLDKALANHGGMAIHVDGVTHDMSQYIEPGKLKEVLSEARKLAEEAGLTVPQTVAIESVVTDNDAIRFIMGT